MLSLPSHHRLNTFGFLYTGTDDAPGNMGLWDQVLALQWVNDNIELFGGDPNRITIFGDSAGGWSTSLHILSPISRSLFQNAILMSGASINRNAGEPARDVMDKWLRGAQAIGCTDGNDIPTEFTPKLIECFRNAPAEALAAIPLMPALMEGIVGWNTVVIIDGEFLPALPLEMLNKGDHKKGLNVMIGSTQDEGSWILWFSEDSVKYSRQNPAPITHMEAYNELSRISRKMWSKESIDGEMVSKVYFTGLSDETPQDILRQTIGVAIGDYLLGCPAIQFAKTLYENDVSDSRVYQYYYNFKLGRLRLLCCEWSGSCHYDDVPSVFGVPFYQSDRFLDREREVSEQMIDIFATFAKTGYVFIILTFLSMSYQFKHKIIYH
jgi:acetylcholinesterase